MNNPMRVLVVLLLCASSFLLVPAFASTSVSLAEAEGQQEQQPEAADEFVPVSQLPAQDQLPAAPLLVTAYAFVWVVLFGYVL